MVVAGYEDGYDDISELKRVSIAPRPNAKEWEGLWQDDKSGEPAVFLFGRARLSGLSPRLMEAGKLSVNTVEKPAKTLSTAIGNSERLEVTL